MMKRFSLLFALAAAALVAGCSGQQAKSPDATQPVAQAQGFKIGIMTGTVSQGEEDYRAAQQIAERYPGRVKTVTFPDNFSTEVTGLLYVPAPGIYVLGTRADDSARSSSGASTSTGRCVPGRRKRSVIGTTNDTVIPGGLRPQPAPCTASPSPLGSLAVARPA